MFDGTRIIFEYSKKFEKNPYTGGENKLSFRCTKRRNDRKFAVP